MAEQSLFEKIGSVLVGGLPAILDGGGAGWNNPYPERYAPDTETLGDYQPADTGILQSENAPWLIGGGVLVVVAVLALLVRK